ncbi:MAG: succinylglutamate desuccinylase/aspartoacylase family protein [Anaerolineales bacterium]|uniref:succinylglutamate desuccinylase/aspartoacylase family protein n=1 Tax=Candidatus Villigracilis vicinus TaxID=3140679 RepID=UPI003134F76E|nr:succinylglutamate desuccinylase/aspartoacylase family protein [Anaerolineales bacterium]
MTLTIGTAAAKPGEIVYGEYVLVQHPVGGTDVAPVVIAQGQEDGPVFWITAGIHGIEHAGIQVIHKLITPELVKQMRGTIVAIPALNPAGLRTLNRQAYYHDGDPNRLFPDGRLSTSTDPDHAPISALEQAYGRIFEDIKNSASFYFDLHCMSNGSLSFIFRDRILYRKGDEAARKRAAEVSAKMDEMAQAYGHTVTADFAVEKYINEKLHRATTAAVSMLVGIPALTAELSSPYTPAPEVVNAGVAGLRNVMRWGGMLGGEMEPITGIKVVDPGFATHRRSVARVTQACIVHHLKEPGDLVKVGDPLVEMRDAWGRSLGVLHSEYDGFVISRPSGILYYPGESTVLLAIRDEEPRIGEYPETYFD